MNYLKEQSYEAPEVTVIEVEVEKGFSVSEVRGWDDYGEYEDSFIM